MLNGQLTESASDMYPYVSAPYNKHATPACLSRLTISIYRSIRICMSKYIAAAFTGIFCALYEVFLRNFLLADFLIGGITSLYRTRGGMSQLTSSTPSRCWWYIRFADECLLSYLVRLPSTIVHTSCSLYIPHPCNSSFVCGTERAALGPSVKGCRKWPCIQLSGPGTDGSFCNTIHKEAVFCLC